MIRKKCVEWDVCKKKIIITHTSCWSIESLMHCSLEGFARSFRRTFFLIVSQNDLSKQVSLSVVLSFVCCLLASRDFSTSLWTTCTLNPQSSSGSERTFLSGKTALLSRLTLAVLNGNLFAISIMARVRGQALTADPGKFSRSAMSQRFALVFNKKHFFRKNVVFSGCVRELSVTWMINRASLCESLSLSSCFS